MALDKLTVSLAIALVLLVVIVKALAPSGLVPVVSRIDGKRYSVRPTNDRQLVADRLGEISARLQRMMQYMAVTPEYSRDARLQVLQERLPTLTISETGSASSEAAFTRNKNRLALCVKNADGNLEDINTSMFVLLHEISHVATLQYNGHDPAFWKTMTLMLKAGIESGVYVYTPYEDIPTSYCGHAISQSPYTCYQRGRCGL